MISSDFGRLNKFLAISSALVTSLVWMPSAIAQDADDEGDTASFDTIVVTANKRPQLLKEVDGTVSVRTGDDLNAASIYNVESLENIVPGLVIDRRGNRNYTNFSIRGITSGDFYTPTLQVYVDGVPQDPAFLGQELLNVERVEVLRGPQGTLYGRSAQSGVINIVTRTPSERVSAQASGRYSSYDWNIGAGVSGPLGDSGLSGSLEIRRADVTGQIDDIATGEETIDESENWFGKARLRYAPEGSNFNLDFTYSHDDIESSEELYISDTNLEDLTFDSVNQGGINLFERWVDSYALTAAYDFGSATLTSISSYQDRDISTRIIQGFDTPESQETFNQELRLTFDVGQHLNGIIGGFYEDAEFTRNTPGFTAFGIGEAENQVKRQTFAIFGELTYSISETVDITGGLRWSNEDAEINYESFAPPSVIIQDSENFDDILPKLAIGWQVQPNQRLYALVSQGFKAGGFNHSIAFGEFDPARDTRYEPETSTNVELGWRGVVADGRIEVGIAGYWITTQEKQAYIGPIRFQYLRNLGDAESYGLEVESRIRPHDDLTLDFGGTFGRSEYTDAEDIVNNANLSGNVLPHAPDATARAALDYRFPLTDLPGDLNARVAGRYTSKTFFDDANRLSQPDYTLLDASLAWSFDNGVAIRVFGDNLTDERYRTYSYIQRGNIFSSVGVGRTFGIELKANY